MAGFYQSGNTQEDIDLVLAFLEKHRAALGSAVLNIQSGIDQMTINKNWMGANHDDVVAWLKAEAHTTTTTTTTTTLKAKLKI
jgi:hypothetical protein